MKLFDIIKANSEFLKDVTVTMSFHFETVDIADDDGVHDSIFMQGNEAEQFIAAYKQLREESPDSAPWDIERHLAKPFVECIWN